MTTRPGARREAPKRRSPLWALGARGEARRLAIKAWDRAVTLSIPRNRPAAAVAETPSVSVYGIYRPQNERLVSALTAGLPKDSAVHLHALGHVAAPLSHLTHSSGSGFRTPLLQSLIDTHPPRPGDWVLIFDDDVEFAGKSARDFVALAAAAGLDISQPAHVPTSAWSFPVTVARPFSVARLTTFVEVGPVLLLSPRGASRTLPFRRESRMGWGDDVLWSALRSEGLRLGVVDRSPIRHLGAVGAAYAVPEEAEALKSALSTVGEPSIRSFARTVGRPWRPWRRTPTWRNGPA